MQGRSYDLGEVDEKLRKRLLKNRLSAERSRQRKNAEMNSLRLENEHLRKRVATLEAQVALLSRTGCKMDGQLTEEEAGRESLEVQMEEAEVGIDIGRDDGDGAGDDDVLRAEASRMTTQDGTSELERLTEAQEMQAPSASSLRQAQMQAPSASSPRQAHARPLMEGKAARAKTRVCWLGSPAAGCRGRLAATRGVHGGEDGASPSGLSFEGKCPSSLL